MRITVFNDTREDWSIHSNSVQGVNGEHQIPKGGLVAFEGPDRSEIFVKVWHNVVMVCFRKRDSVSASFSRTRSALFEAAWRRKD